MATNFIFVARYIYVSKDIIRERVKNEKYKEIKIINDRAKMLGCTDTNFVNTSGYPQENHYTNALIKATEYYNPYVLRGKTGTSTPSGSCFVGIARKGEKTVITVILGAKTSIMSDGMKLKQQFSETNKLIEIGLAG